MKPICRCGCTLFRHIGHLGECRRCGKCSEYRGVGAKR